MVAEGRLFAKAVVASAPRTSLLTGGGCRRCASARTIGCFAPSAATTTGGLRCGLGLGLGVGVGVGISVDVSDCVGVVVVVGIGIRVALGIGLGVAG